MITTVLFDNVNVTSGDIYEMKFSDTGLLGLQVIGAGLDGSPELVLEGRLKDYEDYAPIYLPTGETELALPIVNGGYVKLEKDIMNGVRIRFSIRVNDATSGTVKVLGIWD